MVNPLQPRKNNNPMPPANAQLSAGGPKSNVRKIAPMKMSGGGPTPQHTPPQTRTPETNQEVHRLQQQLEEARKQITREVTAKFQAEQDAILRELFDIADDLGIEVGTLGETAGVRVQLILNKLGMVFHKRGVRPVMPKVGVLFDPSSQEAVEVRPVPDRPNRTVIEVRRPAYANGSRVLRTAQVVVSKLPDPPPTT